jgi:hypothetical protein
MQAVAELAGFRADAAAAGMTEQEIADLIVVVAANPTLGEVMVGTGGARKLRLAGRGRGKSGGFRVITYFAGADLPVFLIGLFAKGDRDNLSKAERNELRKELAGLAADYRQLVTKRARELRRRRMS